MQERGQRVMRGMGILRHSFATWYLRKYPGRLEQLRQLLGHSNLQQVLTYARLAEADLSESYGSLLDD